MANDIVPCYIRLSVVVGGVAREVELKAWRHSSECWWEFRRVADFLHIVALAGESVASSKSVALVEGEHGQVDS